MRTANTKEAKLLRLAAAAFSSILLICAAGCESKSQARLQAQQAFVAGQEQALEQSKPKPQTVTVNGPVRNHAVPWTEDLTLARAVVEADYTGYLRPRLIRVTREGQAMNVNPNDLLRGQDMPLAAGDVVDVIP